MGYSVGVIMAGNKKVIGIIGHPVEHSLSPLMHNYAFSLLKLPFHYSAFDVEPAEIKNAIKSVRALGMAGLNVTVPHKEKVLPFLDRLDDEAKIMGAVNTIYLDRGKLVGTNTDGIGFIRSLKANRFSPKGKDVSMIGAGGSARAIGLSLLRSGISSLTIINRSQANGRKLVKELEKYGTVLFAKAGSKESALAVSGSSLIVQTTPVGMKRGDPLPLKGIVFSRGQYLYDIIYAPCETKLLKKGKWEGAKTINGLEMLVYQGGESFRIWTGRKFPEAKVLNYLRQQIFRGR